MEETKTFENLMDATGLPIEILREHLTAYLIEGGHSPRNLGLDDIRDIVTNMLQDLFLEIKDDNNPFIQLQR